MDEIVPGQVISPGAQQTTNAQPPIVDPAAPTAPTTSSAPVMPQSLPQPSPAPTLQPPQFYQSPAPLQSSQDQPLAEQAANAQPSLPRQAFSRVGGAMIDEARDTQPQPAVSLSVQDAPHQEKGVRWYALYAIGLVVLSVVVYLFTKDVVSTVVVFVALLGLLFLSARKPKLQDFSVEGETLRVGNKVYDIQAFKAFSIIDEGAAAEITLVPIKRLMPLVSLYLQADRADELSAHLAEYLPFEQRKPDAMDSLLRRIRF